MFRIARDLGRPKAGLDFLVVHAGGMTFVPRFVQADYERTVELHQRTDALFLAALLGNCMVLDEQDRIVHKFGSNGSPNLPEKRPT